MDGQTITPTISLAALKHLVEKELNIKDLSNKCRSRELAQARFVYFKLSRKFCPLRSLTAIGREVKRDHATVLHACKTVDNLSFTDKQFRKYVEDLSQKLTL